MKRVSYIEDVALVTVKNCPPSLAFFSELFCGVAQKGVDVDMISQTPPSGGKVDLFFTVSDADVPLMLSAFSFISAKYPDVKTSINGNNCKVTVFDEAMINCPGYAADIFSKASKAGVDTRLIATSESDISMLIVNDGLAPLLQALK